MDRHPAFAPPIIVNLVGLDLHQTIGVNHAEIKYLTFAAIIHFFFAGYTIFAGVFHL